MTTSDEFGLKLWDHVKEALKPFETGDMFLEMREGRRLRVGVWALPYHTYTYDMNDLMFLPGTSVKEVEDRVCREIAQHFREYRVEPEDHIHLGQE